MKRAMASAPTKLILFGEHFVVYGAPGIAVPISPRNRATVFVRDGKPGIWLTGEMGDIRVEPDGTASGDETLSMFWAPYRLLLERGLGHGDFFHALIELDTRCKGIGNSSSIGAALGIALTAVVGKKADKEWAFECAQAVDEMAHGRRPSGIDARTVVEGRPQVFRRVFLPPSYRFNSIAVKLPPGIRLLVIDTSKGKRATTGDLIKTFGKAVGTGGLPEEIGENERERICRPYFGIYGRAREIMGKGTPGAAKMLGALMNENHLLLSDRNVSTPEIEEVRHACLKAGAFGAKISGAGGTGGAVLALVDKKTGVKASAEVCGLGYKCFEVKITKKGAVLEQ